MCNCSYKYSKKVENRIQKCTLISGILISIIVLVVSILSLTPFYDSLDFISVAVNWNNQVIEDITIINSSENCPDGDSTV